MHLLGLDVTAYDGHIDKRRERPPQLATDFRLGNTWAYLIDLKNAEGDIVFRIHYMDAAASAPDGIIPDELLAKRRVDLHIGCVPGYDIVDQYPETVLRHHGTRYVMAAHWEDFFSPRDGALGPVPVILSDRTMNGFVDRVEDTIGRAPLGVAPKNKDAKACAGGRCGPHGNTWTVPVPGAAPGRTGWRPKARRGWSRAR
jgi:hypothetical protein